MAALGIDPQGCLDITRRAARRFHRKQPVPAGIPCFSVGGDPAEETVCWPLQRTFAALCELEGPNDGLVTIESALAFGKPLAVWPIDHFRQINWLAPGDNDSFAPPPIAFYTRIVAHLAALGFGQAVDGENGEENESGSASSPVEASSH
jgi:triacylglycerol lipase